MRCLYAAFLFSIVASICHGQGGGGKSVSLPAYDLKEPVATVGARGGVQKSEYDLYLLMLSREIGKDKDSLSSEERGAALQRAIDDEIIFQAAIGAGALSGYTRDRIVGLFKANHTVAQIDPQLFSEQELQAYYKAHPDEFRTPASVCFKGLKLLNEGKLSADRILKKAKQNPDSIKDWMILGWMDAKEGNNAFGLPQKITSELGKMKKGEVRLFNETNYSEGLNYIMWATDRKEPEMIPFGDAEGKVRFNMIGQRERENYAKLMASLSKNRRKGQSDDDLMFESAIKDGVHRDYSVRQYVINEYVSKAKQGKESLAAKLKAKYPVKRISETASAPPRVPPSKRQW